jgi:mannose-6-phosphate isomerase-like protein (cupin superfamily)
VSDGDGGGGDDGDDGGDGGRDGSRSVDGGAGAGGEDGADDEGYQHYSLRDLETNPEKPGRRWELSPVLGIDDYNVNVAVLEPGERLSQNAYHYHENQAEFYYVADGRCRVEADGGSFDAETDDVVRFPPGAPHMLHNPYDDACTLVAIGSPPEGRYPVHQVQSYEELLSERYDGDPSESTSTSSE